MVSACGIPDARLRLFDREQVKRCCSKKSGRDFCMLEKMMDVSTGVYILWGLGVLGLFLKMFANAYMGRLVHASADMGNTRKKKLRNMRQKYENRKEFGLCGGDEEAYAESFVRGLRFLTRPMEFWNRSGTVLSLVVCGTMAGAYLYYDPSWRGSPDMQFFLANSIIVVACLLVFDHIFVINNKVEILKANIRGYLERIPKPREEPPARMSPFAVRRVNAEQADASLAEVADGAVAASADNKDAPAGGGDAGDGGNTRMHGRSAGDSGNTRMYGQSAGDGGNTRACNRESAASEETLNRFLEEFFSG